MKDGNEVTEILEAFDLTRSFRAAGQLARCSPHTVADWVAKRDRGELSGLASPARRERLVDPFVAKIEEWVDQSNGKIRADVCHDKLVALGFDGSDRTVRRAVAEAKAAWGRRRVYRPWVTEPGMTGASTPMTGILIRVGSAAWTSAGRHWVLQQVG